MYLKFILVGLALYRWLFDQFETHLIWKQRAKPLPEEVKHIYTEERYKEFLSYRKEYRRINFFLSLFGLILNMIFVLSNFYQLFDLKNPYLCAAFTYFVMELINEIVDLPLDYYETFYIEESYHLNKKTKKEWLKDYILHFVFETITMIILIGFLIFLCTNLSTWTNHFKITYQQSFLICLIIFIVIVFIALLLSLLSLVFMKLQYTFTEMEDCELKNQIEAFSKESKKKIRHIKIYNESKKSNSKNAFLLKFLGYRMFGIADNFLDENSHDELLAVLLHEIGHLKHKKNIFNYLNYLFSLFFFIVLVYLIPNAHSIIQLNHFINESFGLKYTNYILSFTIFSYVYLPLIFLFTLYKNFVSCREEKEADYNAVDHGYGQALIDTFTKISSDELIDVNPHPLIELLDYDHPSMYKRISYIQKRQKEIQEKRSSY